MEKENIAINPVTPKQILNEFELQG
jgi:hypothetical protein